MYKHIITLLILINFSFIGQSTLVHAESFYQGTKKINLLDNKGQKLFIGSISFASQEQTIHYKIHLEHKLFKDYFLSMKEMKCLEGPELWCHLAYPYDNPRNITTSTDLAWLSHDLLFMYKKNSEFGANFYNGIYYDFKLESGKLTGTAMALDLNLLAAPPEDQTQPPITADDIHELEPTSRWLPSIEIQ